MLSFNECFEQETVKIFEINTIDSAVSGKQLILYMQKRIRTAEVTVGLPCFSIHEAILTKLFLLTTARWTMTFLFN